MVQTVKQFVTDAYQIITPSSPTVPLHGDDMSKGVQFLNELVKYYSGTSLKLTIAKEVVTNVGIGQQFVTFADATHIPPPDVPSGRLSNLQNAWLLLDGVTYPLMDISRNKFFAGYKFLPLQGLPRFAIIVNNIDSTTMQIYPSPSQGFELHVFGKFELPVLTENSSMTEYPLYYIRFLKMALAKDLAFYKGRSEAWTDKLELSLQDYAKEIESISPINLTLETGDETYLNGSWRVRAGI